MTHSHDALAPLTALVENAREATNALRDAVREGLVIDGARRVDRGGSAGTRYPGLREPSVVGGRLSRESGRLQRMAISQVDTEVA